MKKRISCALAALLTLQLSGCASITVEAPAGAPIQLASTGKDVRKLKTFKKWYMFWGLFALGETSTAQDISDTGFKVVKVVTKMDASDFLLNLVGVVPLIPVSRTVEIWGE